MSRYITCIESVFEIHIPRELNENAHLVISSVKNIHWLQKHIIFTIFSELGEKTVSASIFSGVIFIRNHNINECWCGFIADVEDRISDIACRLGTNEEEAFIISNVSMFFLGPDAIYG